MPRSGLWQIFFPFLPVRSWHQNEEIHTGMGLGDCCCHLLRTHGSLSGPTSKDMPATTRRSADRALLRNRPAAAEGVKTARFRKQRPGLDKDSDAQLIVSWRVLDVNNPPECSGIYALTSAKKKTWYYIGKSQNIAKRVCVKNHPVQVTLDVDVDLHYWYLRVDQRHIGWLERYLIKEHDPEWNGSTSFNASWYTRWMCCDLPLSNSEYTNRLLLAALGS